MGCHADNQKGVELAHNAQSEIIPVHIIRLVACCALQVFFIAAIHAIQNSTPQDQEIKSPAYENTAGAIPAGALLGRIWVTASFVGKDSYKAFYTIDPGDVFDSERHADSLDRIQKALRHDGYVCAQVSATATYNQTSEFVDVAIQIDRGRLFTIKKIVIELTQPPGEAPNDLNDQALAALVQDLLQDATYTKQAQDHATRILSEYCIGQGFLNPTISCDAMSDPKTSTITCTFQITLGERRIFVFSGNTSFPDPVLLQELSSLGGAAGFAPIDALTEPIRAWYRTHGFFTAQVTPTERGNKVQITIIEGPRTELNAIRLKGVTHFDPKNLQERCFGPLVENKFFDQDLIVQARGCVLDAYQEAGFWDARITNEELRPVPEIPTALDLEVTIQEGEQRLLRAVVADGEPEAFIESEWQDRTEKAPPIPFDLRSMQAQRTWLTHYAQDRGHINPDPKPTLHHDGNHIDVAWHLNGPIGPGGQASPVYFGKALVRSNGRINKSVVTRELLFQKGDLWEQEKIRLSRKRLKNLGVFSHIALCPVDTLHDDGTRDIVVHVVTDDPRELRLRGGVQWVGNNRGLNGFTPRAGTTFTWHNLTGNADWFKLDGELTDFQKYMSCAYGHPTPFWRPAKMTYKTYCSNYDQPIYQGLKETLYELFQGGFLASIAHGGLGNWETTVTAGCEWVGVSHLSLDAAKAISFAPRLIDEKVPFLFIEPTIMASYLDDPTYPRRGSLSVLSGKFTQPLHRGATRSFQLLAEQSLFIPIYHLVVGALHLRGGYIFYKDFEEMMPSERFYLGGSHTIRSFDTDMVPPLGLLVKPDGETFHVPKGGKAVFNGSGEIRFPVYYNIGMVVFLDCGMLAQADIPAEFAENFVVASGFGLRYQTPVGPIRFDIGWRLNNRDLKLPNHCWFITFGQAF